MCGPQGAAREHRVMGVGEHVIHEGSDGLEGRLVEAELATEHGMIADHGGIARRLLVGPPGPPLPTPASSTPAPPPHGPGSHRRECLP